MNTIGKTPPTMIKALINQEVRVAVAFSGGGDSLALLVGLCAVHDPENIVALYVNHRLRSDEELTYEIALNRLNAERLGVHFEVLDLGPSAVEALAKKRKKGIEEAARTLRYEALLKACKHHQCPVLLTGHNADDQMETILRRLFTAARLSSLQGIRRVLKKDGVTIIRPLLSFSHQELLAYLEEQGWSWSEDSTNEEGAFQRNQLRKMVTSNLLTLFPGAHEALGVMAKRFGDLEGLLDSLVEEALKQVHVEGDEVSFSRSWFQSLPVTVQEQVLFNLARGAGSSAFVEELRTILNEESSTTIEARGQQITTHQDQVSWRFSGEPWSYAIEVTANEILLPGDLVFRVEENSSDSTLLRIDSTLLVSPVLRLSRDGDEFMGESGRAKVAKILSGQGLDPTIRVPLLVDRSGVVALFARVYGGRDRLAKRFKAPLARRLTNIYSVNRRIDNEVYE